MCLRHSLWNESDHIITSAKHSHHIWRSQIHNSKLTTQDEGFFMADSILRIKSKEFAKDIVFLCRVLRKNGVESALTNQLIRCGTSVGANVHEAQYAQGTRDFISKLEIALKECNESEYWLELLFETGSISETELRDFQRKCIELRRMLVSSVKTLKQKI